MKIVFTGLPHFGKKLVAELRDFDKKNTYVFCNTYYSKSDRFKFIFHLLTADRVVSINGVSLKSGSLDYVIKRKKKLILQWQGTDVLTAMNNANGRALNRTYIDYAKSFTDAEWLKDELKSLNIDAPILHFKHLTPSENVSAFQTADVVSYLSEGKEKFYGIEQLIDLATAFPQTKFHIIGSKGIGFSVPENIIFYGWVPAKKVKELMNQHAIFVRLTEHDGYSVSVLEAIANGNYVLWNHPHPCVVAVKGHDNLLPVFATLSQNVNIARRSRQTEHIAWAKTNLNKETILMKYIDAIASV